MHLIVLTLCSLENFFMNVSANCFQNRIFEKFFQEYHLSVKQIGYRSGPTLCLADLGPIPLAKVINRRRSKGNGVIVCLGL